MNEIQIEITRLIGQKELTFGCYISNFLPYPTLGEVFRIWNEVISNNGVRDVILYSPYWDQKEYFDITEIIGHPANLTDLHRWINEKGSLFRQAPREIEVVMYIKGSFQRNGTHIRYDSNKKLLEQSEECLKQIVALVKSSS